MQGSSTVMTIGTALRRAQDAGWSVEVLVGGQWLAGTVLDIDSHGVMLQSDRDLAVVSVTSVEVVRIPQGRHSAAYLPVDSRSNSD